VNVKRPGAFKNVYIDSMGDNYFAPSGALLAKDTAALAPTIVAKTVAIKQPVKNQT